MAAGDSFVWKRRARVDESSNSQLLICTVLLVAAFGIFTGWLEAQTTVYAFLKVAFGLTLYGAYQSISSHYDSRPQQSRLSTTPKPQGFSDGARLLSCHETATYLSSEPARPLPGYTGKDVEDSGPRTRVLMSSCVDLQLGPDGLGLYG
ncbi:LOW QUALITY PROTEIN: hypothetical protein Ct61P_12973 [Colletotrichum tofieldiae]|nr:LOW QUALITY PROTEIN: hypothetical protein Ct61P_12973 [Colletotrichum tofieldiae]